jgi:hypothetical protein
MTISCYNIISLVLAMLFSTSIARNMFRVYSVNCAAREATLFIIKAIPREIRKEVIIILREMIIVVEKKLYYF